MRCLADVKAPVHIVPEVDVGVELATPHVHFWRSEPFPARNYIEGFVWIYPLDIYIIYT